MAEGITKYLKIRDLSGLEDEYRYHIGKIGLDDARTWQRCINEKRKDNGQKDNGRVKTFISSNFRTFTLKDTIVLTNIFFNKSKVTVVKILHFYNKVIFINY